MSFILDNNKNNDTFVLKLLKTRKRFSQIKNQTCRRDATQTMKKASINLIVLLFGITINGFSQSTAPAPAVDFFAGKWEITIFGLPDGDTKMATTLIRKDGKLTGELKDLTDTTKPVIPITSVVDIDGGIEIAFSSAGYDVTLPLTKVDEDNLKGQLMGMFDAKAKRVK